MVPTSRRRFLLGLGVTGSVGISGCLDAIPRFPKRIHNQNAVLTPTTTGWRSKHGGTARRSVTVGGLPSDATVSSVLTVDDWWEGQPVFGPDQVVVPVQLPPQEGSHEPSFEGILALDPQSGTEQWRFAYAKPFATPTIVGNTVFVQGATTYALDRSDGSVYWEYRSGYGYSGTAPAFVDDVVAVIASRSRSIVGLDARTGEQLWSTPLVQKHPTGIAGGENGIYACVPADDDGAGELVRIEPTTGDVEWRSELHERVSTPVVGTDRVYLWVGNRLVAFDKSSGEQVWASPIQTAEHEYPNIAVDNGQCITLERGGGQKTAVVALDAASGNQQWRRSDAHYVESDPLAMDETYVYLPLGDSHEIGALDRTDGSVVESWALPGHPVTGVAIDKSRGVLVTRAEGSESITVLKR